MIEILLRWIYWGPFRLLVQSLPLTAGYALAEKAGIILEMISSGSSRKLEAGLRFLGYGAEEVQSLKRKVFVEKALSGVEAFHFPSLTREKIDRMVSFEGLEHLEQARKHGTGVILMHGHFGNEELLMPAFGHLGLPVSQLASRWEPEKRETGLVHRLLDRVNEYAYYKRIGYREMLPVNFIYIDRSLRELFTVLAKNEVVLLAADGREGKHWIEVDFIGKKALFSQGPMRIALKSGAVVLPTFILRQPDRRHRIIIHEPLALDRTGDQVRDIMTNTMKFVTILSEYVLKSPSEYLKVFLIDKPLFKPVPDDNTDISLS